MRAKTYLMAMGLAGYTALASGSVMAQGLEIVGQPHDRGIGFQPAATELAVDQQWLDHMILYIITAVVIFVTALLLYVMIRYNRRTNPVPRKFTHNTPLEIGWTLLPILLLVFIGVFSLPALKKQQTFPAGDVVIKVTGNQWYWNYEYPNELDESGEPIAFDSYMIGGMNLGGSSRLTPEVEQELADLGYAKEHFLLATDTAMVVPSGAKVLLQITAADVIHSWTIPAFAVKQDAVPGRIAHAWFAAEREGVYFGQCSELCGKDHAYMPITVKVVAPAVYEAWVEQVKSGGSVELAQTTAGSLPAVQLAQN